MVKKISLKHCIGCNDEDVIRPVCIKLPPMISSVKCFESYKAMSFMISDNKVLKKYAQIWGKFKNSSNIKLWCLW